MPEDKLGQDRSAKPESDLKKMQQRLVDEAVDESFPASDPPAWTTTGTKSVAAKAGETDRDRQEDRQDQGVADQANRLAERISETGRHYWREAQERFPEARRYVDQGRRYMDQGRQAVARPMASYPLAAVAIAGAVGFGLAWWIYGSGSSSRQLPDYGRRQRYGYRPGQMSAAERQRADAHLAAHSRAAGMTGATPNSF